MDHLAPARRWEGWSRGPGKLRGRSALSNFAALLRLVVAAIGDCFDALATNQVEISVCYPGPFLDGDIRLDAGTRRATPMAWSPLGGGGPFGSEAARLRAVAGGGIRGRARGHVTCRPSAMAWLLALPGLDRASDGHQLDLNRTKALFGRS